MSGTLPRRPIGRIGLSVPCLGFGAAPLGNLYRAVSDQAARDALDTALDAGLTYVDTAPYYGFGLSERRVGDAVRSRPDTVISTKVGRLLEPVAGGMPLAEERYGYRSPMPFEPVFDYSYDGVLRSHEDSLQRLGLARIDILYVHDIDSATHGASHPARLDQLVAGGGIRALRRLREEGSIGAIGVGVNEIDICLDLMDRIELDVILLAGRYTLLEQGALDLLFPRCLANNISVVIGGPYNSGILATGTLPPTPHYNYAPAPAVIVERVRKLQQICAAHDVLLGAAALQFVLAHPVVASVIPGLSNVDEVRETVARAQAPIPQALWAELKAEGLLHPQAPVPD
ncbi:aldo/keto reductase [Sphingomonas sp. JC676]|uniref:aldo/keto reductase n=1 Tax=Sphingomonas sp. JC676 TaxID=2768065 RepID=UPI0016579452|nr:aldo/keto reductase [Sphingomonas sp. JC676]MBC9032181.1 aldo/keto reductase [Sphingomonas sp. JC676]